MVLHITADLMTDNWAPLRRITSRAPTPDSSAILQVRYPCQSSNISTAVFTYVSCVYIDMQDDPMHATEGHEMDVDILGETDPPTAADRYAPCAPLEFILCG
jgi:hypothetical protein